MSPRTPHEITQEIHDLKALRPNFQVSSENFVAITAQITALQTYMTADTAHDTWASPADLYMLDAALEAIRWRDGQEDALPSASWKELVDDN